MTSFLPYLVRLFFWCALISASPLVFAQQFPASSGNCRVSPKGLEACEWMSSVSRRKSATRPNDAVLLTTTYDLAPGAPLKKPVDIYDNVIVALTDGSLRNESDVSGQPFNVVAQQAFLMPRGETYVLRNAGNKGLTLLVIELRNANGPTVGR